MTARSRPPHFRRHRRQHRIDTAAGCQAENGAAVVEQIEFRIAPAPDRLFLAVTLVPRRVEITADAFSVEPVTATSLPAASTTGLNRRCRRSSGRKWCHGRTTN